MPIAARHKRFPSSQVFYCDLFLHRAIKERAIKREGIKRETDNRASPTFRDFASRLKCSREWRISRSNLSSSSDSKLLLLALATKKRILVSFRATKKKVPWRFKWKAWCARCLPISEEILKLHRLVRKSLEGYCHVLWYTCWVSSGTVERTSRILPLVPYPFHCIARIVTYPLPVLHRSSNWISELYNIGEVAREEVTLWSGQTSWCCCANNAALLIYCRW